MSGGFNILCTFQIPTLLRDAVLKLLCDFHGKRISFHPEHRINLCIFFAEVYEKIEMVGFFLMRDLRFYSSFLPLRLEAFATSACCSFILSYYLRVMEVV